MAAPERQRYALQTIFSFFLGLMVAAFVGVGVNTFYQSPTTTYEKQMQDINRRMEDITRRGDAKGTGMNAADQAEMNKIVAEQRALQDKIDVKMKPWMRNTSIIVILFATAVMSLSLVRSEQLKVLSNGLLLGGLFTMVYGIGWVIASGESITRFAVMVFALAVTVGLGWLRFVRSKSVAPVSAEGAGAAAPAASDVAALSARIDALEARLATVASVLAPEEKAG